MPRRLFSCALLLALLPAPPLAAQIIEPTDAARDPRWWGSLSIGIVDGPEVLDGDTESAWLFGAGVQARASLERALRDQASIGIVGSYARLPLEYVSRDGTPPAGCTEVCDADGDVLSVAGVFHIGGGEGVFQVIDGQLGVTTFHNFQSRGGEELPPTSNTDLSFSIAYGFGYGFARNWSLGITQEFSAILHESDGLSSGDRRLNRASFTRITLRYGVGTFPVL